MTEPNEVKLTYSEFLETMQKHSCTNCPCGFKEFDQCRDECVDCYIKFLEDYDKTKKKMKT